MRQNCDKIENSHDKKVIDFCKTLDFFVLIGRTKGDPFGNYTHLNFNNGQFTIDYAMCNEKCYTRLSDFLVLPSNELSDHSKIVTIFKENLLMKTEDENDTSDWKQRGILYKWYVWLETTWYIIEMIRLIGNNVVYYMKWYVWLETTWYIIEMIRLIGNNVVYYRNDTSDWKQRGIWKINDTSDWKQRGILYKWYVWLETTWYIKEMIRLIGNNVVYYRNDTSDWKQRGILYKWYVWWKQRGILYKWYVWLETTWYIIEMIRLIGNNVVYYRNDTSDWKQRGIL